MEWLMTIETLSCHMDNHIGYWSYNDKRVTLESIVLLKIYWNVPADTKMTKQKVMQKRILSEADELLRFLSRLFRVAWKIQKYEVGYLMLWYRRIETFPSRSGSSVGSWSIPCKADADFESFQAEGPRPPLADNWLQSRPWSSLAMEQW